MSFDLVIGQDAQKTRLMDALKGRRLAHAYLLHGPSGVGAEALAIELAKAVNCESGAGEPCQHCRACRKIAVFQHPDVHVYPPSSSSRSARSSSSSNDAEEGTDDRGPRRDPRMERRQDLLAALARNPYAALELRKSDYLSIDDIRELRQEAGIKPYEGRRKVVILLAADRMNTAASNALLKTLEEPPGELLLLLVTSRIHQLLPTIVSRCQPLHLARLPDPILLESMMERFKIDADQARLAVSQSDGSLTQALSSVSETGTLCRASAFEFLWKVHYGTMFELFEHIEQLAGANKEAPMIEGMLDVLLSYYRDLFRLVATGDPTRIQHVDKSEQLVRLAEGLSFDQVESAITAAEEAKQQIIRNVLLPLALTALALRLRACAGKLS